MLQNTCQAMTIPQHIVSIHSLRGILLFLAETCHRQWLAEEPLIGCQGTLRDQAYYPPPWRPRSFFDRFASAVFPALPWGPPPGISGISSLSYALLIFIAIAKCKIGKIFCQSWPISNRGASMHWSSARKRLEQPLHRFFHRPHAHELHVAEGGGCFELRHVRERQHSGRNRAWLHP